MKQVSTYTIFVCARHDPWDGGVRTVAFITGGFVPVALRGTTSGAKMIHISDWCALVNVALISSPSVKRLVQSGPKKTNLGIRLFA